MGSTLTSLHLTSSALHHDASGFDPGRDRDEWLSVLFAACHALTDVSLCSFVINTTHASALSAAAPKIRRLSLDESSLEHGVLDLIFPGSPSSSASSTAPIEPSPVGSSTVFYPLECLSINQCRMREWHEVCDIPWDYSLRQVRLANKDLTAVLARLPRLQQLFADTHTQSTRSVKLDAYGDDVLHVLARTAKCLEVRTRVRGGRG